MGLGPADVPKLNRGADAGWVVAEGEGSFLDGTELEAPNREVVGADEAAPNKLVVGAGVDWSGSEVKLELADPNRLDVDAGAAVPNKLVDIAGAVVAGGAEDAVPKRLGAGAGAAAGAGVSAGLMPKRAADAPVKGVALASEVPNRPLPLGFSLSFLGAKRAEVGAEGMDVLTSPNSLEVASELPIAPKRLVVVAAGLTGSLTLAGSAAAGLKPNRDGAVVLGRAATLGSENSFLAGWESFSLSDSPPVTSVSERGVLALELWSCLDTPKMLDGAVLFGAKMEPVGAEVGLPKSEPF